MQLVREKSFNIFLAFLLLVSLIIPNLVFAYEIEGNADNPTLTIHKYEQEPDEENSEEGTGLPGQTASGDPLEGVEFTLTQTHKYNAEIDEWTEFAGEPLTRVTDENGKIVIEGMDLGR